MQSWTGHKANARDRGHQAAFSCDAPGTAQAPYPDCPRHGGLLWLGPSGRPMSWHAANAVCQRGIAGDRHWRLPTSRELADLFRQAPDLGASWPAGYYWSLTLGANGCRQLVRRFDAETYVNDDDRAAFHVALVRRLHPTEWALAS